MNYDDGYRHGYEDGLRERTAAPAQRPFEWRAQADTNTDTVYMRSAIDDEFYGVARPRAWTVELYQEGYGDPVARVNIDNDQPQPGHIRELYAEHMREYGKVDPND